jgi:hypothetical protein
VYFLYEEGEEDEEDEERVAAGGSQSGSGGSSGGSSRGGAGPTRLAHLLRQQHQQQEGEEDGVEAGVSRLPTPLIAAESYVDMSRGVSWVLEREAVLAARCNALMGLAGKVSAGLLLACCAANSAHCSLCMPPFSYALSRSGSSGGITC